jgi:hypothetical protein
MSSGGVLRLLLPAAVLFTACTPQAPVAPVSQPQRSSSPMPGPAPEAAIPAPVAAAVVATTPAPAPQVVQTTRSGIAITAVAFDARTHRLAIADQPGGPGSRWPDAAAAGRELGGIASVNAGFFTPEGAPLGLVASGGKRAGAVNRASSLGAGFYVGGATPSLVRRERSPGGPELLQSGPFLVENSRAIAGLSGESSTARTFIATDGGTRWILARTGGCSLDALGRALAGGQIGGVKVRTALNLDGGRSSDLWVSAAIPGGPLSQRPIWNKPVRNFLVLVPRG